MRKFVILLIMILGVTTTMFSETKLYSFIKSVLSTKLSSTRLVYSYLEILFQENGKLNLTITSQLDLNPILIIALMDLESEFNQTISGDNGKAIGFFQLHDIALQDVCRYDNLLKPIYEKSFKSDFRLIAKYPIRQLEFALAYLHYYYDVKGIDGMIKLWNYNDSYKTKLEKFYKFYKKWYDKFLEA